MKKKYFPGICILAILCNVSCNNPEAVDYSSWRTYTGTKKGNRYSSNDQINTGNVKNLKVAWTYSGKDTIGGPNECTPIIIDGTLFGTTSFLKLFALDAATGKQKWIFDPAMIDSNFLNKPGRGVAYWQDETGADKRILYTAGSKLYAVSAITGKLINTFGENGYIELKKNLDRDSVEDGYGVSSSPGIIYKDLIIIGMSLSEDADALPGHIRAFNVRTGKRRWIFHTIPHPGEVGYDTWEDKDAWKRTGGANSWAGRALDEERGIVYIPTGSATPDFYGGMRKGSNLFANSIIALDAATGKYIWHFQVVHHDLWDRDLPANPNLVTITHNGKKIDALAQITKHGYIFMFDRANGKPIFPIVEKPVPQEALPGEKPWPTQPFPKLPESFSRQRFDSQDVSDLTPETHRQLMERYITIKHKAQFTPPGKGGAWIFPDFSGGGEWGGAAVDLDTKIMYVNSNEVPSSQLMIDRPRGGKDMSSLHRRGFNVYNNYCITCHGPELKGSGAEIPALVGLNKKYNVPQVSQILENGRNRMPPFRQIPEEDKKALLAFLLKLKPANNKELAVSENLGNIKADTAVKKSNLAEDIPYRMTGYNRFMDSEGYPGNKPPWATLNAI
ncbi:MAG: c-type cytochrome, partial [Ginsengibacter sp.]